MFLSSILTFIILSVGYSYAMTDAEFIQQFMKVAMECGKDHPVPVADMLELHKLVVPKKREVKCLLACTYKKMGTINAKGLYDLEAGYKIAEKARNGPGDDKRVEDGKKIADICNKVNDEPVTDGEEGCDRAALVFKCFVDNASKLGFKLKL